jgi:hypothetical protein
MYILSKHLKSAVRGNVFVWSHNEFCNEAENPAVGIRHADHVAPLSKVKVSYIMTYGQSASLSLCQAPIWDPRPIFSCLSLIICRQLQVGWCEAPL